MANKHVESFLTSLIVRKMHMKTTVRHHYTHPEMAGIKKISITKC